MSRARKAFESALVVERVIQRVLTAKADLSDKELIAMHCLTMYKAGARAKYMGEYDIKYSPEDPTIKSLISKGYVKLQGKSLTPDKGKIEKEMKQHKAPRPNGHSLENAHMSFAPSGE
jgi:hypothetical protein